MSVGAESSKNHRPSENSETSENRENRESFKERIKNHINAHIEGEWVREAAIAYANKNKNGLKT